MKNLLLVTACALICYVTAHPHSSQVSSHTHTRPSSRRRAENDPLCALLELITCSYDLCRNSYCYYHPQAVCRMVSLQCGCRAFWFTSYGRVDCDRPDHFRIRTGVNRQSPVTNVNSVPITGRRVVQDPNPVPADVGNTMDIVPVNTGPSTTTQQEGCPHNVLRVECRENPCWVAQEIPGAECRPNYCGGCIADFYRNGMKVACDRCEFPQLIVPSSVLMNDHGAYRNTHQPEVPPPMPTNTGVWTEAGPPIPMLDMVAQGVHSHQSLSDKGSTQTGSSVLSLQGNVASVNGLFPTDPHTNTHTAQNTWSGHHNTIVIDPTAVCPPGKPNARCYSDPCLGRTCARFPSAICRPNPCGNCQAKWYVNGTEVDCEMCNSTTFTTSCPVNPCDIYSCPWHPAAECRMSKCGACTDHWFENGVEVGCDIPFNERICTPQEQLECNETCSYHHCPTDYSALCRVKGCGSSCKLEYYKVVNDMFTPVRCHLRGLWYNRNGSNNRQ